MPVLQEVHHVHPFSDAMDSDICLVILAQVGGPSSSTLGGLAREFMNSLGINGARKWMPLFAATRVVMVEAITRRAMTLACE